MARVVLLVELKRAKLSLKIIEKDSLALRSEQSLAIPSAKVTKPSLIETVNKFLSDQSGANNVQQRLVVACLANDAGLVARLGLQFAQNKFNGLMHDPSSNLAFVDKHELVCLNDFGKPSSFFEFNQRKIQTGEKGLIVSLGNHLQTFEEHTHGSNQPKQLVRIGLGALSFSPHTDLDHDFSLFIRKDDKRTVKYHEVIGKDGFKLSYLFHLKREGKEVPREPRFKELLQLLRDRDETAVRSAEFFLYLLAHFLYSGLILCMLNKELILTGNFLTKIIEAFGNPDRVRQVFLDNLVLAHHVRHTFDHLRMLLQTDMANLVIKSALENL